MATEPPATTGGGMIGRIKGILLTPKEEWPRIAAEPMTTQSIMVGWVAPLAAIAPVASIIGSTLLFAGVGLHPSATYLITVAVIQYVLSVAGIFVLGLIIDALATSFGGTKDPVAALKVAAFGCTAGFLAGIFAIVPVIGVLGLLLGLYNLYLIYLGLPVLMKAPEDKVMGYTVVALVVALVVNVVAGALAGAIAVMFVAPYAVTTYAIP